VATFNTNTCKGLNWRWSIDYFVHHISHLVGDMEKITNNFQWRWCILLCIKEGKNHRLFNKSDLCQALNLAQLLCTQTSLHLNKSAEMFNITALFQQTLTDTPLVLLSPKRNSFHVHCKSSHPCAPPTQYPIIPPYLLQMPSVVYSAFLAQSNQKIPAQQNTQDH
jgi:hypothetical protein